MDNLYDTGKLVKINPVPLWRRYLLRALLPISGVKLLIRTLSTPQDINVLHDGKRANLTGEKVTAVSRPIDFAEIKQNSKLLSCTINDLMTSALVLAVSRYFKDKNDTSKAFNICMPANIRWNMYQTREEVRLENKFAPIPLRLETELDPAKCLKQVKV
jgi:hypothetical protein